MIFPKLMLMKLNRLCNIVCMGKVIGIETIISRLKDLLTEVAIVDYNHAA